MYFLSKNTRSLLLATIFFFCLSACDNTGPNQVDTTPPALLSALPTADGDRITINFDESLDPTTVSLSSFSLYPEGEIDAATVMGSSVTLILDEPLPSAPEFTYMVTASAIGDLEGNRTGPLSIDFIFGETPAIATWVGSYTSHARWGATHGTWGNGGTYPLIVEENGTVMVGSYALVNYTYDESENALAWTMAAGNPTNGRVVFRDTFESSYFFADQPGKTAEQNFTGFIQKPGEGGLDYRGLLK